MFLSRDVSLSREGEQLADARHVTQLLTVVLSLLNRRAAHSDLERQALQATSSVSRQ